ncbi:Importin-5 [Phlyctochytrium planicorne]|nr:Importin-5 [Phlyctochytrium planicorne]
MAHELIEAGVRDSISPELTQILERLLQSGTDREVAEKTITADWQNHKTQELYTGFAFIVASPDTNVGIRSLAAVLLRKLPTKFVKGQEEAALADSDNLTTYWNSIQPQCRQYVKEKLLMALNSEQDRRLRSIIADTVAELNNDEDYLWPELKNEVEKWCASETPELQETALHIIKSSEFFIKSEPAAILNFVIATLSSPVAYVKIAACKTSVPLVKTLFHQKLQVTKNLDSFVLALLNAVGSTISDEEHLKDSLQAMIDLTEHSQIFCNRIVDVFTFLYGIMTNPQFEPDVWRLALEFLVCFAECKPPVVRKFPDYTTKLIPLLLEWMCTIDDDPNWHNTDDLRSDDDEADEIYIYAEQALDRLSLSLTGKTVVPIFFEVLPRLLGSADWKHRYSGLLALSSIGEGSRSVMVNKLQDILNLVVPYLRDPHPRVRYAACNAVGQMAEDFAPDFYEVCGDIVGSLIPLLDDAANPRVQTHCGSALVNICENMQKDTIAKFLVEMFPKLLRLLHSPKVYVQEQAITAIAVIADSAADYFNQYYGEIMPVLIQVMQNATDKHHRLLRGKAIECVTLIAVSVGLQTFEPHMQTVLNLMVHIQQTPREDDDPVTSYLMQGWNRISRVIGKEFVPYLPIVMAPIIAAAKSKTEMVILEEDDDQDAYPEEEGWEFTTFEGQKIGIKTTNIEEKLVAIDMLGNYAHDLRGSFVPYIEQSFDICSSLFNYVFHEEVRNSAVAAIPSLFECMLDAEMAPDNILAAWNTVLTKMLESISKDNDAYFPTSVFAAIADCFDTLGGNYVFPEQLEGLMSIISVHIKFFSERIQERQDKINNGDIDEDDAEYLEAEEEGDDMILTHIARCIGKALEAKPAEFLPYFNDFVPILDSLAASPITIARHFATIVYGDLIKFHGPIAWNYHDHFIPLLGKGLTDKDDDIRQMVFFAVGVAAENGGPNFHPMCVQAIPMMIEAAQIDLKVPNQRMKVMLKDNAVAAICRILKNIGRALLPTYDELLRIWVASMPVLRDGDEVEHTTEFLLELIQSQNPVVLGEGNSNLPQVVKILAELLANGHFLPEELTPKIVAALHATMPGITDQQKFELWNSFNPEKRETLKKFLNGES